MRINVRILVVIVAVLVLAALSSKSSPRAQDPNLPDTVKVDSVVETLYYGHAEVPVSFVNDEPLAGIQVVLTFNSSDVAVDSFSFVGSRVDYLSLKGSSITDSTVIAYAIPMSEPLVTQGSGLLGTIYFSFLPSAPPQVVTIDTITIEDDLVVYSTTFSDHESQEFAPQFVTGYLDMQDAGCCIGVTGNVNNDPEQLVNIVDLTYLGAYLFGSGPEPPCWEEGNVNGDPLIQVNIVDLTYLSAYLFGGGPLPPPCP